MHRCTRPADRAQGTTTTTVADRRRSRRKAAVSNKESVVHVKPVQTVPKRQSIV